MTDFNFSIIIVFIMFSMIAILLLSIKLELTVKAGKVTKYCGKYAVVAYQEKRVGGFVDDLPACLLPDDEILPRQV